MRTCANHPKVPSVIDCARCGTFLCQRCVADARRKLCVECDEKSFELIMALATRKTSRVRMALGGALGVVGLALLAWLVADGEDQTQRQFFIRFAVGSAMTLVGAVLVGFGAYSWWQVRVPMSDRTAMSLVPEAAAPLSPAQLLAEVQRELSAGRRSIACMSCRVLVTTSPCGQCGSSADTLEVRNAEELRMLAAAIEP